MVIKTGLLIPPKSPNLLIAPPAEYEARYFEQLNNALRLYFAQLDSFSQAVNVPRSGVTADRPVSTVQVPLAVGEFYFDTTLGYPIWYDGADWVDATGTVV
jgi:hypothetical protein